jgi:DNA-binding winged helix-turn-helix (wHTH) protein/TolB-like protein/predicted Zn-dependent protease
MDEGLIHFYEFGSFRLDVAERTLRRGVETVPLNPKVFDTLLALVRAGGRVVLKEELLKAVWPDSYVEEGSLTHNISVLRKALEGTGEGRKYIETVPRRGYRFIAEVRGRSDEGDAAGSDACPVGQEAAAALSGNPDPPYAANASHKSSAAPKAAGRRGWKFYILCAGAFALAATTLSLLLWRHHDMAADYLPKSVAILPFKSISGDADPDPGGLGMANAIALKLGGLQRPTVLPANSVFKYAGREADARAAGRELGVDAVMEGAVQRSAEAIRVTAQLIRVGDGKVLWSGTFDARYGDIFVVQDSISEQVAEAITPRLTSAERERLAKQPTRNTEAYQAYTIGAYFWSKRSKADLVKAIEYFREAIGDDPNYALAYAKLSDCYHLSRVNYYEIVPAEQASESERVAAEKAIELDETSADSHIAMAAVKEWQHDYKGADSEYRRAVELDSNSSIARVRYAYFLYYSLRLDEALPLMERAQELDPASPITTGALGFMLMMAHRYDESITYLRRALDLDPSVISGHCNLGTAYVMKGQFDEAIAEFQGVPEQQRLDALQALGSAYALAGRRADALKVIEKLVHMKEHGSDRERQLILPYNIALIYSELGDNNNAFAWLDRQDLDPMIVAALKYDAQLDLLSADPRFAEFLCRHDLANLRNKD